MCKARPPSHGSSCDSADDDGTEKRLTLMEVSFRPDWSDLVAVEAQDDLDPMNERRSGNRPDRLPEDLYAPLDDHVQGLDDLHSAIRKSLGTNAELESAIADRSDAASGIRPALRRQRDILERMRAEYHALRKYISLYCWKAYKSGVTASGLAYDNETGPLSSVSVPVPSCVIVNAVPKSGTYLLHRIIAAVGKWHDTRIHLCNEHYHERLDHGRITTKFMTLSERIGQLRDGQLFAGHIGYEDNLDRALAQARGNPHVRMLFLFRDPRDVLVSYTDFVTTSQTCAAQDQKSAAHQRFMRDSLSTPEDRLAHVISNWRDLALPQYVGWLSSTQCLPLRFEDLYSDVLKLREGRRGPVIARVFDFVGADAGMRDPRAFFADVFGRGPTATSIRNKIGRFRRRFTERHWRLVNDPEFREIVARFGYEW